MILTKRVTQDIFQLSRKRDLEGLKKAYEDARLAILDVEAREGVNEKDSFFYIKPVIKKATIKKAQSAKKATRSKK